MSSAGPSLFGLAGGQGPGGQPFSRFQLGGDPSPYYPVLAAHSIQTLKPAHMLPDAMSPYRYGPTHVGGVVNMINRNGVLLPIADANQNNGSDIQLLLGGTGGGNFDAITNATYAFPTDIEGLFPTSQLRPGLMVSGEFAFQDTTTTSGHYGAVKEGFVTSGTGVTVNNGSTAVTGIGGTTWTTDALITAYGYTPSFNAPRAGDILEVINAGISQFYRITTISSNTSITIFPAYNAANAVNQPYKIWRTGFGSYSRVIRIYINGVPWLFYAGNQLGIASPSLGAIQAINPITLFHYMAPAGPAAADLIYYKGFFLYGGDGAVGWSVSGAPTGGGTPIFGAGDFPALNISTRLSAGQFVSFEQLGEQLLAIYTDSVWLVQATSGVPEFAFYQLPEITGELFVGQPDQQFGGVGYQTFARNSTTGRGTVFYKSWPGLMGMRNLESASVSDAVDGFALAPNFGFAGLACLSYDVGLDQLIWTAPAQAGAGFETALLMDGRSGAWTVLDLSSLGRIYALGGGVNDGQFVYNRTYRQSTMAYWLNKRIRYLETQPDNENQSNAGALPWKWASRIITMAETYPGFSLGSVRPICRAAVFQTPTFSLQIYAGNTPYNMQPWGPALTISYQYGVPSARYSVTSGKCDSAYIALVATGTSWIELAGFALYSADVTAAR